MVVLTSEPKETVRVKVVWLGVSLDQGLLRAAAGVEEKDLKVFFVVIISNVKCNGILLTMEANESLAIM